MVTEIYHASPAPNPSFIQQRLLQVKVANPVQWLLEVMTDANPSVESGAIAADRY